MSDAPTGPGADRLASRFPTAYTILFLLIVLVGALTWIIPAGQFDRVESEAVGREIAVAGTYKTVEANPQGPIDILMAPVAGFYDPVSYSANAIDVALFVIILGGFLGVVNATGAIDTGIRRAMARLKGREIWMIPILMSLFALGGTTYGMAEETLAFYGLLIPVMIAAGYDAVTGAAIILLGAGIGTLGSTINPFATVIASNAAGVAFTDGLSLRLVLLIGGLAICIAYVMRYAMRVRRDPSLSRVADLAADHRAAFAGGSATGEGATLTGTQSLVLVVFALTFAALIWGVSSQGWWMAEMSTMFFASAIVVGLIGRLGEKGLTGAFITGAAISTCRSLCPRLTITAAASRCWSMTSPRRAARCLRRRSFSRRAGWRGRSAPWSIRCSRATPSRDCNRSRRPWCPATAFPTPRTRSP